MNLAEVAELISFGFEFRFGPTAFTERDGICVSNGHIPLPVFARANIVGMPAHTHPDIPIFDESAQEIGCLCLCNDDVPLNLASATDARYAAYIREQSASALRSGLPFLFRKDYVVIRADYYANYKSLYLENSSLWGGYVHDDAINILPVPLAFVRNEIRIRGRLAFPTSFHAENSVRSVVQTYGFERFLKLYHLLELLLDSDVVEKIRSLSTDLKGISKLIASISHTDISRLRQIIKDRCSDVNRIAKQLDVILNDASFNTWGREIFFNYGKDGNTFADEQALDALISKGGFASSLGLALSDAQDAVTSGKTLKEREKYLRLVKVQEDIIHSTAAYWLYRVRCSIAHNRIGEYVMSTADEQFVVHLAEPLIREILCQALREP